MITDAQQRIPRETRGGCGTVRSRGTEGRCLISGTKTVCFCKVHVLASRLKMRRIIATSTKVSVVCTLRS